MGGSSAERLHRAGYFAHFLAGAGHDVVWWTSAFDHFKKTFINPGSDVLHPENGLELRLLRGCGYKSNVSLARIRDHKMVAAQFAALARKGPKPDVILCSFPTIELSLEAIKYGKEYKVPVILDMRDMWPDIFQYLAPSFMRPLVKLFLSPWFYQCRKAFSDADAITGITEEFVEWGLARAGRPRRAGDKAFPMGYSSVPPQPQALREAELFWDLKGIEAGGVSTACFMGTMGRQLDLPAIIDAARILKNRGEPWRFVLCGVGDNAQRFQAMAKDLPNVIFPGWVKRAQIYALMRRSAVGLDPLPSRFDFLATINNKAIEYLSAGLPVISSPAEGALFKLLSEHGCGASYPAHNGGALAVILSTLTQEKLHKMAANAKILYDSSFVAEKVYAGFAAYLAEIAGAGSVSAITDYRAGLSK